MTNQGFYELMDRVFSSAKSIAEAKGKDYTKGSLDALANFKEGGKAIGIDPKDVCWIFMNKHYQAITNYVKTKGQSESEPIDERIKDMINYLVLLLAIIIEERREIIDNIKAPAVNIINTVNIINNDEPDIPNQTERFDKKTDF